MNINTKLNDIQYEILNGALLGDGCIPFVKNGNSYFSYVSSIKNHVLYISQYFLDITTNRYRTGSCESVRYDIRTNKMYSTSTFRTKSDTIFTTIRNSWYDSKNVKVIPKKIILTPLTCLIWYIGDGCLNQDYINNGTNSLKLATYCFDDNEIKEILLPQLSIFDARIAYNENNKPYILIPRCKIDSFFNYIGNCPINEYKHKWNLKPYKNKNIEENGMKSYIKLCDNIINDFNSGLKPYQISKKYNIDSSVVKYHLCKVGLFKYNTENNILKLWEIIAPSGLIYRINNLTTFCKEQFISDKMLRRLAHGKCKYYKGWNCKIIT
jgi:hypothetical protein